MRTISSRFLILPNKEELASDLKKIDILSEIDPIILKLIITKEDLVVRNIF